MKKFTFLLLSILMLFGCSKKSDDSTTSEYSNKLQLGKGLNVTNFFELTGVGTTFEANALIYFRLESSSDMSGSDVKIQIDKQDGSSYNSLTYTNTQNYGHIFLSSFIINDPGTYKATGILIKNSKTVASTNFTIYVTK
ncbi:MAG: hypothetical protein Q8867_02540 [Bacteroidota bacterium]|nr:hypothetical protein [Bacteroidota bacterium]